MNSIKSPALLCCTLLLRYPRNDTVAMRPSGFLFPGGKEKRRGYRLSWLLLPIAALADAPLLYAQSSTPGETAPAPSVFFGFETPQFTPGDVDGQLGWWVDQGSAEVVPGIGLENSAALRILPDDPFTQARLTLLRPDFPLPQESSVLFLDAWVRLPAAPWLVFDETFDLDSARIGLFRSSLISEAAEWHVFHGDGGGGGFWVNTGVSADVDPFTDMSVNWTRLTVREDLATQRWDLWADGELLAMDVGFQYSPEADRTHFFVLGDTSRAVLLDNVSVSSANPLGPDADRNGILDTDEAPGGGIPPLQTEEDRTDSDADGLPDAWELARGYDPSNPDDAASDMDGDGLNTLDEFLLGTNAAVKDTRRQFVADTAAVFNRSVGTSARRAVQR